MSSAFTPCPWWCTWTSCGRSISPRGCYRLPARASNGICQHFIPDSQGRQVPDAGARQVGLVRGTGGRLGARGARPTPSSAAGSPGSAHHGSSRRLRMAAMSSADTPWK
jgi:hypothetical protein